MIHACAKLTAAQCYSVDISQKPSLCGYVVLELRAAKQAAVSHWLHTPCSSCMIVDRHGRHDCFPAAVRFATQDSGPAVEENLAEQVRQTECRAAGEIFAA